MVRPPSQEGRGAVAPAGRAGCARGVGHRAQRRSVHTSGGDRADNALDGLGGSPIGEQSCCASRSINPKAERTPSRTADAGGAISSPRSGVEPQAKKAFSMVPSKGSGNARLELATVRLSI